jgi:hypothetical protein
MAYDKDKKVQRDIAMGTTHTIEGTMHKKALERDAYHPKPVQINIPPVTHGPYIGSKPQNPAVGGNVSQDVPSSPSWVSEFVDKHYPKTVPLPLYFVLACVGCLIGVLIGHASGNAIGDGLLGAALGFFAIPIVVIGFHLAIRALAVAAVVYVLYLIIRHMGK